jgi:hypothetical protein
MYILPRSIRSILAISAFVIGLAPLQLSADVIPVTFEFTGACAVNDCTGVGTGMLTLANYSVGDAILNPSFISFFYSSNLITISIPTANDLAFISGGFSAIPGGSSITIQSNDPVQMFITMPEGTWCAGSGCLQDMGSQSTWTLVSDAAAVPEPALFLPAGLGLMAFGLIRRRRK